MTLGSLFAGIGGFELAATWAGIKPIWSNEIEKFPCDVLRKNFNHRIIEDDIKNIGNLRKHELENVDIITGGFPCQPFSVAGERKGENDSRYLWEENIRIIREKKPFAVIGENVAGIISMDNGLTLEKILSSLENEGYKVQPFIIPACAVGAWHRRERIWIVAYSESKFCHGSKLKPRKYQKEQESKSRNSNIKISSNNIGQRTHGGGKETIYRFQRVSWGKDIRGFEDFFRRSDIPKPVICRNDDGFSGRVDRLKGLGNAIVPQVAFEILKSIKIIHEASI